MRLRFITICMCQNVHKYMIYCVIYVLQLLFIIKSLNLRNKINDMRILSFIINIFILSFTACNNEEKQTAVTNSEHWESVAMANFMHQPERSLQLLDSAVNAKTLTPQRAEYLKAIVVCDGLQKPDSAMSICQHLIDAKAWEKAYNTEEGRLSFEVDIYRFMAAVCTDKGNQLAVIRYCTQGARLSHGVEKLIGDEADFLSRSGFMMCQTGQTEEGLNTMRRAEELALNDDQWSSMVAYINNAKKIYFSLADLGRYADAEQEIRKADARLDQLKAKPSAVRYIPAAMLNDSTALNEYVYFYKAQFHAFIANACSHQNRLDEARLWIDKYASTTHHLPPNTYHPSTIYPLIRLGRYDDARQIINTAKSSGEMDSVSIDYVKLLKEELNLERQRGNHAICLGIAERIISLTDSCNRRSYQITLADAATQYKLQDEQIKRQDSEARFSALVVLVILVVFVIVIVMAVIYIKKLMASRKILNQELNEAQKKIESLKESQKADSGEKEKSNSPEELYERALFVMEHYQCYRDPAFDINALAQQIFSNRTYTSAAINQKSGMNFRSWLAKYRIDYAISLLEKDPDIKVDALVTACGFDSRTNYYRQFKNIMGMSPAEWMNGNKEDAARRNNDE